MSDERKAFVDILTKDRFDAKTRLVFADWLEEHGCDDEAAEQRRMASPEWVEVAKWMEKQTVEAGYTCMNGWYSDGDEQWREITFDDLIRAGHDYLRDETYFTQIGSERLRAHFYENGMRDSYWKHWSTITSVSVEDGQVNCRYSGGKVAPFSCSC